MGFRNQAAEFVYVRTYARWQDTLARRENWEETVERYINWIVSQRGENIPPKVIKKIRKYMLEFSVMPSMRAVWAAGETATKQNLTIYNCSFRALDSIEAFAENLFILACGTGFGFSIRKEDVEKLPEVPTLSSDGNGTLVIPDSREGWADSIKQLIESLYVGKDLGMDYSLIRPKGAKLKTMGGRASGSAPLITVHAFIREVFSKAQGRKLSTLECLDISNQIAEIVVSGGVRRSSQISLSDLDDELVRDAKTGAFPARRYMSNNSAIYDRKPTAVEFLREWSALASSGSGERGIFNLEAARNNAPKRRDNSKLLGCNPCVTGDTEILTDKGYVAIESVVDTTVTVWNGFEWSEVIPKITGENVDIMTVTFSDGRVLNCTPYHTFHIATNYNGASKEVIASELEVGAKLIKHQLPLIGGGEDYQHAYTQGFISAEGMDGYSHLSLYEPKKMCVERLTGGKLTSWDTGRKKGHFSLKHTPFPKSFVPFNWSVKSKLDWLSGLFDGDGTELKEGGLQLASVDIKFLDDTQKLLSTLGIQSKVTLASKAGMKRMPDGRGGSKDYHCQEARRLLVGATQMQQLKRLGLHCIRMSFDKEPQRDASQFVTVTDVSYSHIADKVYCFNEPKRHLGIFNGVITGQCSEILLRNKGLCNLSEVVVRAEDDLDTLMDKVETATWMGAIQSTFTDFPYLSPEWKMNAEEERLLGVSLTGQLDNKELLSAEVLRQIKKKAIKVAKHASQKLGINMPAAITCTKPSGTVSQLVDSASGLHPRYSKFYIRRYRISATDPLFKMLRAQGVPFAAENGQELLAEDAVSTWVLSFPVKAPDSCITRHDMTALEQLEWYKTVQTNWCEHSASCTIYVKDDEWFEVGNWVYKNWEYVNGLSFLPSDGGVYKQAPYEEISESEYEKIAAKFPVIDYSQLSKYELEDSTVGAQTLACVSGVCEL